MALVVDISALLSVVFPDEDDAYAASVIRAINTSKAVVPNLFWFEIRNALLMGERRRRITAERRNPFWPISHYCRLKWMMNPKRPS